MDYTKQLWTDAPATTTPISAARLNYMEEGIRAANDYMPYATITVQKNTNGTWPARPTARADVTVAWKGPDPSPAVVSSGTGGMRDGIDYRLVTP